MRIQPLIRTLTRRLITQRPQSVIPRFFTSSLVHREEIQTPPPKEPILETTDVSKTVEEEEVDPEWYTKEEISGVDESFIPRWMKVEEVITDIKPGPLNVDLIKGFLIEQRAEEVSVVDVRGRCDWTQNIIVAQAQSLRHLFALSDGTRRFIKECQNFDSTIPSLLSLEGDIKDEWLVLDVGNTIIHFMSERARATFQIEAIWQNTIDPTAELLAKLQLETDPEVRNTLLTKLATTLTPTPTPNDILFEDEEEIRGHLESTSKKLQYEKEKSELPTPNPL